MPKMTSKGGLGLHYCSPAFHLQRLLRGLCLLPDYVADGLVPVVAAAAADAAASVFVVGGFESPGSGVGPAYEHLVRWCRLRASR